MTNPTFTKSEKIALKLGWKYCSEHNRWNRWCVPGGTDSPSDHHEHPPDYEHDWAHAGPLLEELVAAYGHDIRIWEDICGLTRHKVQTPAAYTLTEAIADAFLAWKKEENA